MSRRSGADDAPTAAHEARTAGTGVCPAAQGNQPGRPRPPRSDQGRAGRCGRVDRATKRGRRRRRRRESNGGPPVTPTHPDLDRRQPLRQQVLWIHGLRVVGDFVWRQEALTDLRLVVFGGRRVQDRAVHFATGFPGGWFVRNLWFARAVGADTGASLGCSPHAGEPNEPAPCSATGRCRPPVGPARDRR